MTDRDKKTIRIGAVVVVIYLLCFYGIRIWKKGEAGRNDFQKLVTKAEQLQQEYRAQENKVLLFEKLSENFKLDPRKIVQESMVASASAAIQTAAQQSGIGLGPLRENPGRGSARELSTIMVEGTGPVPSALGLLHKLKTLGYPLIIDAVQFSPAQGRPGNIKVNVTVILLNYEQWKSEGPNA